MRQSKHAGEGSDQIFMPPFHGPPFPNGIHGLGWRPDLADHRDFTHHSKIVSALLGKLKPSSRKASGLPDRIDWRDYCGPIEDQQGLETSTSHACVALVQQFERRSSGQLLRLSRLFAYHAARRILNQTGYPDISLRDVWKAMIRCGIPPEKHWPYDAASLQREPDPFVYSFQQDFRSIRYLLLDDRSASGREILQRLKSFLAAGFSFAFGFPVCSAVCSEPEIPFPTAVDSILGGQAVVAVGYDDKLRIRSDKGALLVRNSWGSDWGDHGFGWLPYAYVRERLAVDFWTLLKPSWLKSGEFNLPR